MAGRSSSAASAFSYSLPPMQVAGMWGKGENERPGEKKGKTPRTYPIITPPSVHHLRNTASRNSKHHRDMPPGRFLFVALDQSIPPFSSSPQYAVSPFVFSGQPTSTKTTNHSRHQKRTPRPSAPSQSSGPLTHPPASRSLPDPFSPTGQNPPLRQTTQHPRRMTPCHPRPITRRTRGLPACLPACPPASLAPRSPAAAAFPPVPRSAARQPRQRCCLPARTQRVR